MHLHEKNCLWLIGFALVYCLGVNERENQISGMGMFQSNIYYHVRTKGYIVSTQELGLHKRLCMHKILVHAQDSCACTTLLCMRNTLVHALEGPGTTAGTQKKRWPRPDPQRFLLGPGLGPWPLQCMHKTVVHAQEPCACTRILYMHKNLDMFDVLLTCFGFLSFPTFA